jgi:methionine-rich copper-binding protein CopC
MNLCIFCLLLAALAALPAPHAAAHAKLERTAPAAGSAVRESPAHLTLWFSQRVEPAFSEVRVLDAKGEQVNNAKAQVDRKDAKQLDVSLPRLAPGTYRVQWRVLSVDTHVVEGRFTFHVLP